MSPRAAELGAWAMLTSVRLEKPPSPSPRSTETLLEPSPKMLELAVTTSGLPSPSRSPRANPFGLSATSVACSGKSGAPAWAWIRVEALEVARTNARGTLIGFIVVSSPCLHLGPQPCHGRGRRDGPHGSLLYHADSAGGPGSSMPPRRLIAPYSRPTARGPKRFSAFSRTAGTAAARLRRDPRRTDPPRTDHGSPVGRHAAAARDGRVPPGERRIQERAVPPRLRAAEPATARAPGRSRSRARLPRRGSPPA